MGSEKQREKRNKEKKTSRISRNHGTTLKDLLKILHARLPHYANQELPGVQAVFRKGKGIRYQIANIRWIMEKARQFQRSIYLCFIDYAKTLTV